ncbi:MAG: leucine-rich repeat domain-containing protein [Oscillospiraceae bacterium]
MKKKLVTVLVVIAVVLALGIAGAVGFIWYRNNHVFVEGDAYDIATQSLDLTGEDISLAYYEELKSKLPDCEIKWMVPFQDGKYANDTEQLVLKQLSLEDVEFIVKYFPNLKELELTQCHNYDVLAVAEAALTDCEVEYFVNLGHSGHIRDHKDDVIQLEFLNGAENEVYDFDTLMKNLVYFPELKQLSLKNVAYSLEQVESLRAAYPEIEILATVEIFGQEYDMETAELNLSAMTGADVPAVTEQIQKLPNLTYVNLNPENGTSALALEDVKNLMEAVPTVKFDFSFDFFGHTLSTADEEVHIKNTKIGNEGEQTVRSTLDLLKNCKRFVLENCQISNEVMAKIRDDYRHQTKVVWRVSYGIGSTLTDAEVIRAVYELVDDNCHNLIYCEDAKYMDIGHNEWLDACDFVSGMKSLEYVIISGAPIKSLEPFRNCKNLKMLEAAFCEYITDVSPLADCPNLQMLNISNTHVTDLTPLDNLPLTHLTVRTNPSGRCRLSQEEQDRVTAQHPNCWISFSGAQPYGVGWRYGEDELQPLDHYKVVRIVFRLAQDPNIPNHVGWYLKDNEREEVNKLEEAMDAALAALKTAPTAEAPVEETISEETLPEETVPAETVPAETTA